MAFVRFLVARAAQATGATHGVYYDVADQPTPSGGTAFCGKTLGPDAHWAEQGTEITCKRCRKSPAYYRHTAS